MTYDEILAWFLLAVAVAGGNAYGMLHYRRAYRSYRGMAEWLQRISATRFVISTRKWEVRGKPPFVTGPHLVERTVVDVTAGDAHLIARWGQPYCDYVLLETADTEILLRLTTQPPGDAPDRPRPPAPPPGADPARFRMPLLPPPDGAQDGR